MVNRFSKGPIAAEVRSTFTPMPLDFIAGQLNRKQNSYDSAKASINASQDALYGVKAMKADAEALSGAVSEYDKGINTALSQAGGDYGELTSFTDELGRKLSQDMKRGQLGAIHNNFTKAQAHLKETEESYAAGNISEAGRERSRASITGFGGTVEDGKGGYTQASFYTPTKAIEMGKTADTYGTHINDQYHKNGEKYINAETASNLIYQNMYNNPAARKNAEEQVWSIYGDLPEDTQRQYVKSYLKNISEASGNKLAYLQHFKPDEDGGVSDLTGGFKSMFQMIGAKPINSQFRVGTESIDDMISRIENAGKPAAQLEVAKGRGKSFASVMLGMQGRTKAIDKMGDKGSEQIRLAKEKQQEAIDNAAKNFSLNPITATIAEDMGISFADSGNTVEQLKQLQKGIQERDAASANTQIALVTDKDIRESFEQTLINPLSFDSNRVYSRETGEEITGQEKVNLLNSHHASSSNNGSGKIHYGGQVIDDDQHMPQGTTVFGVVDASDKQVRGYFIPPVGVSNPKYRKGRAKAAMVSGYERYINGGDEIQMIRKGDVVIEFVNGIPVNRHVK